ncbi:MAG: ASKHA domain-containing protein [Candidatus Thorarchaeota archaeon]
MTKHTVMFEPSGLRISVNETSTFLEAIRLVGLHLPSDCGGAGTCGKCALLLNPAPSPAEGEQEKLTSKEIKMGVRLACQHKVKSDTRAVLYDKSGKIKILTEGFAYASEWTPDPGFEGKYGIAIDLGTTTIVAYLLELKSGVQLNQGAVLNPQIIYGEDVISRITYAVRTENGLVDLSTRVTSEINSMIDSLVESSGVEPENMVKTALVGNTAMHHLILGANVETLGVAPYKPSILNEVITSGSKLNLQSFPDVEVFFPPNIAGFVGGDTVGFILSQRLDLSDKIVIGIDVGTNGEIVLSNCGNLSCCSAAAGPAFEGATIRYGMRGQEGAIEYVKIENPDTLPEISVIGNVTPRGICGSAIVDCVAELRKSGILDSSGRIQENSSMVFDDVDFGRSYLLVEETKESRKISFTQKDVRQVQLAKAAISAGVKVLLEEAGITTDDVESVMLAGAFGSYIRPESALGIGLLPQIKREQIIQVGNAAGEGAKALLLSSKARDVAKEFVSKIHYVELAAHSDFQSIFLDSVPLP